MVRRLDVMKWLILLVFAVLISRLGYLQVVQGQHYVRLSDGNRIRIVPIQAPRGIFYDRNGVPLVSKRPSFAVTVATGSSPIPDAEMAALSRILAMDVAEISGKINRHTGFSYVPVRLKTDVDQKTISKIEENRSAFPGIVIKAQPVRKYIYQDFAAHIFGYVGEISGAELQQKKEDGYKTGDIIGKAGLEKVYDKYIRGTAGAERIEVDVNGQPVQMLDERQPVPGNDVVLTLDYSIQQAAEQAMDERLRYLQSRLHRRKAKAAAAVVMNPKTGEILAMASRPAFNPNVFNGGISEKDWNVLVGNPFNPLTNRAIAGEYPPGSVFKIITGTAALELGKVTTQEKILDTGKHWLIPKGNAGGEALGWIDFKEALSKSDNVYFYEMGNRVGIDNLEKYARLYGLGAATGINLPGEAKGLVANRRYKEEMYEDRWYLSETFDAAIGQGFQLVTPLQMAMVMGEVANGGYRYRPFLVSKVVSPAGKTIQAFLPEQTGRATISGPTLAVIRHALQEVALPGGTAAHVFQGFPVAIAGKTGTAENSQGDDHGWFVAYAPFENPQVVVAVVVEHGGYGSQSAAPIAKDILAAVFHVEASQADREKAR
ncbi:penicillin-binding protein 2 [Sporomusa rhizae]|uniref:penicillin-binding protein 2 n=1 Tax=Sporomusa rhizae TaxID=357999 RepID=UPI00352B277B